MIRNLRVLCIQLLALSLLSNCSKSNSTTASTDVDNLITQTYSSVTLQASKASGEVGTVLTSSSVSDISILAAPSFGADWDTNLNLPNSETNVGSITAKQYMGLQLTPSAVRDNGSAINAFGRLNQALRIFCAVGVASGMMGIAVDSSGYPTNGTHVITFTTAIANQIKSQCNLDIGSDDIGTSFNLTVADSSNSFDKSFTFDNFQQTYLIRATSTEVNIATGEVNDNGVSVSRTVVFWNKTTQVMRMEYVSDPGVHASGNNGLYGYRLYFDEANDEAQLFTYEGPDDNLSQGIRYILAGKPNGGDAFSFSFRNQNIAAGALVEACINSSTGAIITDGSRCTASSTRLAGADISGGATDTMITNFYNNSGNAAYATVTSSTAPLWTTMANMITADFAP
jgi:hypothetical protein